VFLSGALRGASGLPTAPAQQLTRGIYVHIPFCLVHCPYCDFNAHAGMDDLKVPYVEALLKEIRAAADGAAVETIFFGGGTPTELPPAELARILRAIRESFDVAANAEVAIEANPESTTPATFGGLLAAGFTRVSLGVQSLAPHVLTWLGRAHTPQQALAALRDAIAAGFGHVNADLIFGTPGETMEDWRASLEGVLVTGVDHVSTYALQVEERTPLKSWVDRGLRRAPDDDDQADRYGLAAGLAWCATRSPTGRSRGPAPATTSATGRAATTSASVPGPMPTATAAARGTCRRPEPTSPTRRRSRRDGRRSPTPSEPPRRQWWAFAWPAASTVHALPRSGARTRSYAGRVSCRRPPAWG